MALTIDVTGVENWKTLTAHPSDPERWHPTTEALMWLALACGFGEITAKNCDEVFRRVFVYEHLFGAMRHAATEGGPSPVYLGFNDVRLHIGMRINVPTITQRRFYLQCDDRLAQEISAEKRRSGASQ